MSMYGATKPFNSFGTGLHKELKGLKTEGLIGP